MADNEVRKLNKNDFDFMEIILTFCLLEQVMRALISELKIMVHLGQHLNVVNLLGAVTKNIAQRE